MGLRFEGDINVWVGGIFAAAAAVAIFWLYNRETSRRGDRWIYWLPILRGLSVALIILMLTGPVLRGSVNVADLSRVLIFVDGSQSMSLTDESMSPERKLLNARRLGFVEGESIETVSDSEDDEYSSRFDELTRWQRTESALLSDDDAIVPSLVGEHHVDLLAVSNGIGTAAKAVPIWQPHQPDLPETFEPVEPIASATDLSSPISEIVDALPTTQQLSVVIISDGQHNRTAPNTHSPLHSTHSPLHSTHSPLHSTHSPLHLAKLLGRRGVPIFTVGVGAANPPKDLAVLAVQTPESVFADNRVKGEILIKDNMPAGQRTQVRIEIEGQTVWTDQLTTGRQGTQTVEFDFDVKQLVEDRLARSLQTAESVSMPLPLNVSIEPLDGETRDDNNSRDAHVRAITRPRRALLIDGRPRWEFRYLRNMLDRDDHWEVNHVLAKTGDRGQTLPRGDRDGRFPSDRKQLFSYDVIVLGEVPSSAFRSTELEWLNQFVASRGGGLVLIDGQRGKLRSYSQSPLKTLLPIRWTDNHREGLRDVRLSISDRGRATAAFAFEGDSERSAEQWTELPPLRWLAPAEVLPGCETLVTGDDGAKSSPALVMRRYGAGTVLYIAFDESWRWRYEVADEYHQRYWNQLAGFVMEPPYAVHDRFVSLDTGGFMYEPGESAELKVRLRDASGHPVVNADAEAILYRDETVVATIPLEDGVAAGGVFRGTIKPLQSGTYQVGIKANGYSDDQLQIRAEFVVTGDASGEMNVLYCHEELLSQMAELSGGQYLREEDIGRLPELLAPFADGKDETTEIALWRSWFWFLPLVGLFTAEWFLRKKMGLM